MGVIRWGKICGWLLLLIMLSTGASGETATKLPGETATKVPGGTATKLKQRSAPVVGGDYARFLGELETAGALSFYDNTEDILRLAQFERALTRFRFLKGQVQGSVDYRPLVVQIDYRLRFLKKQLRLTDWEVAAIPPRKIKRPKPPDAVKPSMPAPAPSAKGPGEAKEKDDIVITDTPPAKLTSPPLPGKSPVTGLPTVGIVIDPTTGKPPEKGKEGKEEKAKGEAAKDQTPAPPPRLNVWQKLRKKLPFLKKVETEQKTEAAAEKE